MIKSNKPRNYGEGEGGEEQDIIALRKPSRPKRT